MIEKRQWYYCEICKNLVEVLDAHAPALVCCHQPMVLLEEKTADQGKEKHVPIMETTADGILVKVGDVPHPMLEEHSIQLIEVLTDNAVYRRELIPGEAPEAEFKISADEVTGLRAYCNLHGAWKG